ncbi:hypothetical protein BDP55DRAFT_636410 [Colletotrichum godetiae]|uniref:Uncharacterized protein n=1 Tax=Colletotrichum godetiae TaxID=1209918 RepID=A0AAJ0ABP7_9PEZI|nr:uncharacterized protein BDP55DRAFT_636410 [Colletotrichum godetiae]KAK1660096.1 hypothetical protein BDP55DRAFT_636410 [Colletotrichum godetiae]
MPSRESLSVSTAYVVILCVRVSKFRRLRAGHLQPGKPQPNSVDRKLTILTSATAPVLNVPIRPFTKALQSSDQALAKDIRRTPAGVLDSLKFKFPSQNFSNSPPQQAQLVVFVK